MSTVNSKRAHSALSAPAEDSRIYLSARKLIALRAHARGFVLNPSQFIQNQYVGRHPSKQRGRGLNFEELSHYRIGDDTRTMDWKVTNRTGKPHVRVYTEERERPVMLACDQRVAMFFGSQHKMKSVVAAEVLSLLAWRQFALGDAIASLLFNDTNMLEFSPQRSSSALLEVFQQLSIMNRSLSCKTDPLDPLASQASLNKALHHLMRLCPRNNLIVLISDLQGYNDDSETLVKSLAIHNDVFVLHAIDAAEKDLPASHSLIAGNGELQIAVGCDEPSLRDNYRLQAQQWLSTLAAQFRRSGVGYYALNTVQASEQQLRQALPEASNVVRKQHSSFS
ncbi:MAG: DUF58 domain-containing protein [Pseudomonadales bacterium]